MGRGTKDATVTRRKKIVELIQQKGEVYVAGLSKQFKVSEVTIRKDLDQLEKKNLMVRARGGAMNVERTVAFDQKQSDKAKLNQAQKAAIGKKAVEMIIEGDTIIINSGTTTAELVKKLPESITLNVITNALDIINALTRFPNVNIIVPGGYLRHDAMTMVGPFSEKNLANLYVNKAFIGVDGFDVNQGANTPNIDEAHLNEMMIQISNEIIILADSSKFDKRTLNCFCPLSKINSIVTDKGITTEDRKKLVNAKIQVIIAD